MDMDGTNLRFSWPLSRSLKTRQASSMSTLTTGRVKLLPGSTLATESGKPLNLEVAPDAQFTFQ